MININYNLTLDVGYSKNKDPYTFEVYDRYTLNSEDDISTILHAESEDLNYAELYLADDNNGGASVGFICSFSKTKIKGKGYRWIGT